MSDPPEAMAASSEKVRKRLALQDVAEATVMSEMELRGQLGGAGMEKQAVSAAAAAAEYSDMDGDLVDELAGTVGWEVSAEVGECEW